MVEKTPQQYKIRAILSWILTIVLAVYYLYLGISKEYDITAVHYILVGVSVVFSVFSTFMAVRANNKANDSNDKKE